MTTTNPAPANNQAQAASLYPNKPGFKPAQPVIVGGEILMSDPIEYNTGRKTAKLVVRNTGDRPIPATTAVRFEPGDQKEVEVVAYSGKRRVIGFNGLVMGYTGEEDAPTYFPARIKAVAKARKRGFKSIPESDAAAAAKQSNNTKK